MISNSGTSTLGLYDLKRQVDAFGGVDYFRPNLAGGYLLNARVMLADGDIVKSTIDGNTNDPNVDMTGWRLDDNTVESIADLIAIENPKNGQTVYVKSYFKTENLALVNPFFGGGKRVYVASRDSENDGFLCINGWVLVIENNTVNPEQAGAKVNDKTFDNSAALQKAFNSGFEVECLTGTYYTHYPVYHRSGFKLRGQGFWNKTRIYKITNNVGDLPDVLSPDGQTLVSYRRDATLIAIPDSGDYCHNVEISNILIGREWNESDPVFLTGYAYYAPYLAQSEFNSVWCNATRFTWYVVCQWMCTFNRCEGSGGEWVVGGLDGDVMRGGTTSTYNSCWSKVIHIAGANAWTFTDMTTVTMNSCGTDGLGLLGVLGGAVIKAKNSHITINGFGIEVTHSENLFDFENSAINIKALNFYMVFNNYGRLFKISGGVVGLDCSSFKLVNTDVSLSLPDFAIVSDGGSLQIKNTHSEPPLFKLSNIPQNKNAVIIAADSHGLIEANGSRQEWSEGDGINKTNRALQITNNTENIGVMNTNAIHYSTNSFQLGQARLFRDSSGLLRQTRNNEPVDQYDGVPVGGIPIYPNDSQAKPIEGNFYFNSTTSKLRIFNGAAWMSVLLVGA